MPAFQKLQESSRTRYYSGVHESRSTSPRRIQSAITDLSTNALSDALKIIGGVAAGTKAASRARRLDPDLEITVYQEEPEVSISECGLPYFLSGIVEQRDQLIARTPEKFAECRAGS